MGTSSHNVAVLGASGFVGSAVVGAARAAGVAVEALPALRVRVDHLATARAAAGAWRRSHGPAFDDLCRRLAAFDVVVNAAGVAEPGSTDRLGLFAANAVMPAVVAAACAAAGVRRLVHISTAAVQGRTEPLDETSRHAPMSPYSEAKAEAERYLLGDNDGDVPSEVVVYRPASVHGAGRPVSFALARRATGLPFVPVAGRGDRPVPVALVDNVGAGVVFAATADGVPSVVLHPWEGITVRRLLELFGARRIVSVPDSVVRAGVTAVAAAVGGQPVARARLRRLELALRGQALRAERLQALGFRAPVGIEGWERVAAAELAYLRGGDPGEAFPRRAGAHT